MWPHAPLHTFEGADTYMVTSSTLHKQHLFGHHRRLELLQNMLFELADRYNWQLHAWAIFSNHYHFVAQTEDDPRNLSRFLQHLHANTARDINRLDASAGRQVWFQFRDTRLTFEKSYLARLRYTHQNAVHHRLVDDARDYPFCSAGWFEKSASLAFQQTLATFKTDKINMPDEFEPRWDPFDRGDSSALSQI